MFLSALSIDGQNSSPEPLDCTQIAVLLLCTVNFNIYKETNTGTFFMKHS